MSQDAESAIEVKDEYSLAASLEQGWNEQEAEPEQELPEPKDDEALEETDINPDEESEEETDEPSDEEETESDESEDQEPEAEEGENFTYENVSDLAEATGQSLEDFLENTKITRKIDGVEEEVTLAELRNGNQRDADYRRKTTELAENRKAFEGEVNKAKEQLGQQFQEAAEITATLEQQLMSEFQSIDWNALELEDREEWLVQRQKFGERQQQIQEIKGQTQQKLSEQQKEIQARQQEERQAYLANQNEMLLTAIPEWSDTSVRESEAKEMSDFLGDYGFNESEVGAVIDHRLVKLARDAMKNRGKSQTIDTAKKKVKKLPKLVRPGAKPDKVVAQKKQQAQKRNEFIKKDRHSTEEVANFLLGG